MSWTLCMNQRRLALVNLQLFADKIHASVSPLYNCWGFIDGTDLPICRPRKDQRILYSGHKKVNAIKFQSVVTPNGLITNLYGPVAGRRHHSGMLVIRLISQSSTVCPWAEQQHPQFVWRSGVSSSTTTYGSLSMCSKNGPSKFLEQSHEPVEGIGRMDCFKLLIFKKRLKLQLSTVGKIYIVSEWIQNARTCTLQGQPDKAKNWTKVVWRGISPLKFLYVYYIRHFSKWACLILNLTLILKHNFWVRNSFFKG